MRRLAFRPGIAGCDEAGRGPLAGPVVCAAVLLPEWFDALGLDDSKRLAPARREELAAMIKAEAHWVVEVVPVDEVDRLNVLWAAMAGMARALARLQPTPQAAVVDGDRVPDGVACPCLPIVGGDGIDASIAAASILAKTERDRIMRELEQEHPGYGFDRHFGYATPEHVEALRRLGPCPIHRRSFAPVRQLLEQPCLVFDA